MLKSETLWIVVGAIVVLCLIIHNHFNRPKQKSFLCGRCRETKEHSTRTIKAWRIGKKKYFCSGCHKIWLETNNFKPLPKSGGCLPLLFVTLIVFLGLTRLI